MASPANNAPEKSTMGASPRVLRYFTPLVADHTHDRANALHIVEGL